MKSILQPGIKAPDFALPVGNREDSVSLSEHPGENLVLIFFPSGYGDELLKQLAKYQARMPSFEEQDAVVLGISDTTPYDLKKLSREKGIEFPLLSDANPPGATARKYGVSSPDQPVVACVFVMDDQGLIRRVYEPSKYPNLPNPAMVTRAIKRLADVPRPVPVSPDPPW